MTDLQKMISADDARWALARLWFIGAGAVMMLLAIQSFAGVYAQNTAKVWGWFLPNVMPVLGLMVAVFRQTAMAQEPQPERMVQRAYVYLLMGLSFAILIIVVSVILATPYLPWLHRNDPAADPMATFDLTALLLAPMQGLTTAGLGALFVRSAVGD